MPKTLTVKQAARLRKVDPQTIHRWLKAGTIPDRRLPGMRRHAILVTDLFPQQVAK